MHSEIGFGMDATIGGLAQRGYVPRVVYDIGASNGSWTRMAMRYWPEATYVCFEPLAEWQKELAGLRAEFPRQVILQLCGVGDNDTELAMGVTDFLYDSSFAYSGASSRKVVVRRLDTLLKDARIPAPSFMKLDVQGFEKRVLDGGLEAVRTADLILLECTFFQFCEDMRTLDITIADLSRRGFVPYEFVDFLRRPLDGAMGQCDMLFIRKDHKLVSDPRWG